MRARLAPSANRTAISFWRAVALASWRFATLAHAMSITSPTAPSRVTRVGRTSPVSCSCIGTTVRPQSRFQAGSSGFLGADTFSRSARPCATVMPGFSRPMTSRKWLSRSSRREGGATNGITNSGFSLGRKFGGSTPITVNAWPSSRMS